MEIEKGIPIPEDFGRKTKSRKYPFDKLEVGNSFVVGDYSAELQRSVGNAGRIYAKFYQPEAEYTTRKTEDNKLRCWRVK